VITNPCHIAASEYEASTAIKEPLVEQIVEDVEFTLDTKESRKDDHIHPGYD